MKRDELILRAERELADRVNDLQNELYILFLQDVAGDFLTHDNKLIFSVENISKTYKIDRIVDEIASVALAIWIGQQMNELIDASFKDFSRRFGKDKVKPLESKLNPLRTKIGLKNGKIIKGSYLDTLSQQTDVKLKLKDFILKSLAEGKDYNEYIKGVKQILKGEKGQLQKYYVTYVNDVFADIVRTADLVLAKNLGLEHFIYTGGLIPTSRQFCINKDGKHFHVSQAEDWRNDPTLPDPASKDAYNPLIDLGRWNCRHWLTWITKQEYDKATGN